MTGEPRDVAAAADGPVGDREGTRRNERAAGAAIDDRSGEFEEGRYLYCVVRIDGDRGEASFSAEGIEGRDVGLVVAGDLAAVAQPCESLYDASDPATVKRWLLRHQAVVDAAGDAFGTPLPFRFDTVVVGDDEQVREWLEGNGEQVRGALDDLAGRWEYRIEVTVEDDAVAETLESSDDRLASLRTKIDAADEGRAFLHEKQYEERLRALRRERREARVADLLDRVEPFAERVERTGGDPTAVLDDAEVDTDVDGDGGPAADTDGPSPVASVAVLATPDEADAIGEELEAVAADPGVTVRYTGPWPPYTFAPAIDADAGPEGRRR